MQQPTRLIRDSTGGHKLEVSLPGGRYQLSLDDRAVNVLLDDLALDIRDTVPDHFVPFFVATGDAWFPTERDTEGIIDDLKTNGTLQPDERTALIEYVTGALIPAPNTKRVLSVVNDSPIANDVKKSDLRIKDIPDIPEWSELSDSTAESTSQADSPENEPVEQPDTTAVTENKQEAVEVLQEIPGIGPERASSFVEGGVTSLREIATSRPVELATIPGITEDIAAVAIEGARQVKGETSPAERLSTETGCDAGVFEAALSSLAASGVPATEAESTLRVLFGPTVADLDDVSGQQAYYLWESGYQTPFDIIEATSAELREVYSIGEATVGSIQNNAQNFIDDQL